MKGSGGTHAGTLVDISAVGAKVVTTVRVAEDRESIELVLEGKDGSPSLVLAARVMFARERDGKISSGVQFMDLDAARHRALHAYLAGALEGDGGGSREHPRISHRVDVTLKTPDRARAALDNISRGGFGVVADFEVAVGEPLTVFLRVGKLETPLELPGKVVRTKPMDKGRHQVGVKLDPLPPASQKLLDELLAALVSG
jgi:Tfp pilus assembly protein PilZ